MDDGNNGGDEEVECMLAKLKLSQDTYLVTHQGTYPYPPREYAGEGSSGSLTAGYDNTFVYANPPSYSSYDYLLDSTEQFNFPEEQQHTYRQVENKNRENEGTDTYPPLEYAGEGSAGSFAYTNPPSNSYLLDSTERFNFSKEQQHAYRQVDYMNEESQGTYTYPLPEYAGEGSVGSFAYTNPPSNSYLLDSTGRFNFSEEQQQHAYRQDILKNVTDLSICEDCLFNGEFASMPVHDPYNPEYTPCYSFGTTIIWLRYSDNKLLVGVDSQLTNVKKDLTKHKKRQHIETLGSRSTKKFIQIWSDVEIYAAMAGNFRRCEELIEYVKNEMSIQTKPYSFALVCKYAANYICRYPISKDTTKCVVFLCGWIQKDTKYEVVRVEDGFRTPQFMNDYVFGVGNMGFDKAIEKLESRGALVEVKEVVHVMLELVGRDPYTGGPINVYSLVDGTCEQVDSISLLDELCGSNKIYEKMFYKNSMMVFAKKEDELKFTPIDLCLHIESEIYIGVTRNDIIWLRDSQKCVVYLVRFPSPKYGKEWYAKGTKVTNSELMIYTYVNLDNVRCNYFYGHANPTLLASASMLV